MNKLTAIALASGIAMIPVAAKAAWKENWLVGLSGGYNWYKNDIDVTVDVPGLALNFSTSRDVNANEWVWGGLVGYQAICNRWLMGGELNIDWEGDTHTQSHLFATRIPGLIFSSTAGYKRETTVGLTGRLGYQSTCWLWSYLRAGIETSIDRYTINLGQVGNSAVSFSNSLSERSYRFLGGIGFEIPIPTWEELSVRAEYDYHSKNRGLHLNGPWAGVDATSTTSAHNHTNTVKIAIIYNLGK